MPVQGDRLEACPTCRHVVAMLCAPKKARCGCGPGDLRLSSFGGNDVKASLTCICLVLVLAGSISAQPFPVIGEYGIDRLSPVLSDKDGMRAVRSRLRICTYNIENFTDGLRDGRHRKVTDARRQATAAAGLIDEIAPDILVIQEIENERSLRMLNRYMQVPFPVGYITTFTTKDGARDKLNIAVLSRVSLLGVREFDFSSLSGEGWPPRGVLSFYIDLGNSHYLLAYGVHLKSNWGDRERNQQRRRNAMHIIREDADGVREKFPRFTWETIVLGDMNVDPDAESFLDDPSLSPFEDWNDLWRGQPLARRITIPTRYGDPNREFPSVAFDRFIVSPELESKPWSVLTPQVLARGVNTGDVHRWPGKDFSHVSDHYPAYVDVWVTIPSE